MSARPGPIAHFVGEAECGPGDTPYANVGLILRPDNHIGNVLASTRHSPGNAARNVSASITRR